MCATSEFVSEEVPGAANDPEQKLSKSKILSRSQIYSVASHLRQAHTTWFSNLRALDSLQT